MPTTETITFTGGEQTWQVPSNVETVTIESWGAGGAAGGATGDPGGFASGDLAVTPGETLYLYVGGAASGQTGGFNGGADGGSASAGGGFEQPSEASATAGGGGGASDVRQGGNTVSDRVIAAGGGAGGGDADATTTTSTPGDTATGAGGAGGATAEDGANASTDDVSATGGTGGGSGAASGSIGASDSGVWDSDSDGADEYATAAAGGGGGGGFDGGAGGGAIAESTGTDAAGAGGGGGDGYTGGVTAASSSVGGGNAGDGEIQITYTVIPTLDSLNTATEREITLNWTNNDTYDDVNIYRATSSGAVLGDYTQIDQVGGSQTTYTDTGLLDGERYFYVITAVVGSDETDPSNELDGTTILPAPTNLTHPSVDATSADYSWTANHNNGDTRVEYKNADTSTWQTFSTVSNTTEAETVTGLLNGTDYDSRVVAQTEHTETVDT